MRFESNCFAEEEKVVCLEIGEHEFEIKGNDFEGSEEEGEVILYIDKKDLNRIVKKIKKIFGKTFNISCENYSIYFTYKMENGWITIKYGAETFKPEYIFFYISEVDVGYVIQAEGN